MQVDISNGEIISVITPDLGEQVDGSGITTQLEIPSNLVLFSMFYNSDISRNGIGATIKDNFMAFSNDSSRNPINDANLTGTSNGFINYYTNLSKELLATTLEDKLRISKFLLSDIVQFNLPTFTSGFDSASSIVTKEFKDRIHDISFSNSETNDNSFNDVNAPFDNLLNRIYSNALKNTYNENFKLKRSKLKMPKGLGESLKYTHNPDISYNNWQPILLEGDTLRYLIRYTDNTTLNRLDNQPAGSEPTTKTLENFGIVSNLLLTESEPYGPDIINNSYIRDSSYSKSYYAKFKPIPDGSGGTSINSYSKFSVKLEDISSGLLVDTFAEGGAIIVVFKLNTYDGFEGYQPIQYSMSLDSSNIIHDFSLNLSNFNYNAYDSVDIDTYLYKRGTMAQHDISVVNIAELSFNGPRVTPYSHSPLTLPPPNPLTLLPNDQTLDFFEISGNIYKRTIRAPLLPLDYGIPFLHVELLDCDIDSFKINVLKSDGEGGYEFIGEYKTVHTVVGQSHKIDLTSIGEFAAWLYSSEYAFELAFQFEATVTSGNTVKINSIYITYSLNPYKHFIYPPQRTDLLNIHGAPVNQNYLPPAPPDASGNGVSNNLSIISFDVSYVRPEKVNFHPDVEIHSWITDEILDLSYIVTSTNNERKFETPKYMAALNNEAADNSQNYTNNKRFTRIGAQGIFLDPSFNSYNLQLFNHEDFDVNVNVGIDHIQQEQPFTIPAKQWTYINLPLKNVMYHEQMPLLPIKYIKIKNQYRVSLTNYIYYDEPALEQLTNNDYIDLRPGWDTHALFGTYLDEDNYFIGWAQQWWEKGAVPTKALNYFAGNNGQPHLEVVIQYRLKDIDAPGDTTRVINQTIKLKLETDYGDILTDIHLSGPNNDASYSSVTHIIDLSDQWLWKHRNIQDRFNKFAIFMEWPNIGVEFQTFKIDNIKQYGLLIDLDLSGGQPNQTWSSDVSCGLQPDTGQLEEGFWDISNVDYNGITVTEFQETASAPDYAQLVFVNPQKTLYPLYNTNDYKIQFSAYVADSNGSIGLSLRAEEFPYPYSLSNEKTESFLVSANGFENREVFSVPLSTLLDNAELWREYNKLMFRIDGVERKIGITDIRIVPNE